MSQKPSALSSAIFHNRVHVAAASGLYVPPSPTRRCISHPEMCDRKSFNGRCHSTSSHPPIDPRRNALQPSQIYIFPVSLAQSEFGKDES